MTTNAHPLDQQVAFASYVDRNYLPGFEVLMKSLLLTNPWIDHDYIVLYDDLEPTDIERISVLYPRFVFRRVEPKTYESYEKGDATNYLVQKAYYILDAFRIEGYGRLVTLDVDMVVLGDISELVETDAPFGAVPQHFDSDGGRRINSGVMTFSDDYMSAEFVELIDRIGRAGEYDLERHDQGVLSAALSGNYTRIDKKYNLVKRAVSSKTPMSEDTRILHYTGRFKPWNGAELGYAALEEHWHIADLNPVVFWRSYLDLAEASDPIASHFREWARPFAALEDDDFTDLRAAQARYRLDGNFAAAFAALRAAMLGTERVGAGLLREYGVAAMAVSRPKEARVALTQASAHSYVAPLAYTSLAELAWTYRQYDEATEYATAAIQRHPTLRKPRLLSRRIGWSRDADRVFEGETGPRIGHVAFYVDHEGNFGDVMLPVAVRASVEDGVGPIQWSSVHAHQIFDLDQARWANENLDALVIGGGGLFLPDTAPNANSGWQWNVTDEAIEALEIPIVVYTVGYNLFPGQQFYGERFSESLRLLVRKAAFVGLRNHGSVDAVKQIVGPEYADKIEYLPCVTTVYGGLTGRTGAPSSGRAQVLLNVAFDRKSNRFGDGYQAFVEGVADLVRGLDDVAQVRCLAHTKQDEQIVHDLRRSTGITLPVDTVYGIGHDEALDLIGAADVVVGMRGHAGMIPFGIGVPIVSVISHAKLRYFLEDIDHPEWGVDADDSKMAEKLESVIREILRDREGTKRQLDQAQAQLRSIVDAANERISDIVNRQKRTV